MGFIQVSFSGQDLVLLKPRDQWPPEEWLSDVPGECALELLLRACREAVPDSTPRPQLGTYSSSVTLPISCLSPETAREITARFHRALVSEARRRARLAAAFDDPRPFASEIEALASAHCEPALPALPPGSSAEDEAGRIRQEVDTMLRKFRGEDVP